MTERRLPIGAAVIVGLSTLALLALALFSPAIFNDGDTFWHIRAGQWMLGHHAVLTRDPFSLSFAGHPWQAQEWLAEIAFAGSYLWLGWSGVALLTGLALAAATALLASFLAKRLDPVPCVIVLALSLSCVMPDFLARPHILALPFTVTWLIGISEAAREHRRPRWSLLLAMLVWANLHGSFAFGLALLGPFAIEALQGEDRDRPKLAVQWAAFAAAAVGVTLLNPRGLDGLLFPFRLMNLQSLHSIAEWQSPKFGISNPVELALLSAVFFFVWRGARLTAVRLLVLLALAFLWLEHARYGMLLGIAGAVLCADALSRTLKEMGKLQSGIPKVIPVGALLVALTGTIVVLAAFRVSWPEKRLDGPAAPISALASLPASLTSLPVFNNYAFGGLLIFSGIRPLVDSRADLFGDTFLSTYARVIDADPDSVGSVFRKYRVAWTILKPGDPLVSILDQRPGWRRIYSDRYAVIQVGPNAVAKFDRRRGNVTVAHLN